MADNFVAKLLRSFDDAAEAATRRSAQGIGRRSVLATIGKAIVGGAALPMLPFDRSGTAHAADAAKPEPTDTDCDYWRYCSLDGFLCTCCGGTVSSCPPGSEPSAVTWVGTCQNPKDGKAYLVSYNDCCGKTTCGRCLCNANVGERPGYLLGVHNDINWCMANTPSMYHCTVSIILDVAN